MRGILKSEGGAAWVPTGAACKVLRVSRQRLYQLEESGAVIGRQVCGTWLWNARSIAARVALLRAEEGDVWENGGEE